MGAALTACALQCAVENEELVQHLGAAKDAQRQLTAEVSGSPSSHPGPPPCQVGVLSLPCRAGGGVPLNSHFYVEWKVAWTPKLIPLMRLLVASAWDAGLYACSGPGAH